MAIVLSDRYEQIGADPRGSAVPHADETGWGINGTTCSLLCFASAQVCYSQIGRTLGSPALQSFFRQPGNERWCMKWGQARGAVRVDRSSCRYRRARTYHGA